MAIMTPSAVCYHYHPQQSNTVCRSSFSIVTSAYRTEQKAQKMKPKTNSGSSSNTRSVKGFGRGRKELWGCVEGCGACCKLAKGPSFATPEEIFTDPADIELYRSLIGVDGWCIHFEKSTRTCSIYPDRPYFCRVEPEVFKSLYGIDKKKFNKEACSCCRDTIKAIYGSNSAELNNFNRSLSEFRGFGSVLKGELIEFGIEEKEIRETLSAALADSVKTVTRGKMKRAFIGKIKKNSH